jgi:copper chaperone CopZ
MVTKELKIEGMSCHHCVMALKKELGKLDNLVIEEAAVGHAKVQYDDSKITGSDLEGAVDEAGFKLVEIKD